MDKQQKQVIERLENIIYLYNRESRGWHDCNDIRLNSNDIKAIEKAIELIKDIPSAEPREVLYSGDGYADGYMVYDMAECPNCGYEYKDGDKDWGLSFCPNCGQKLNWESEE